MYLISVSREEPSKRLTLLVRLCLIHFKPKGGVLDRNTLSAFFKIIMSNLTDQYTGSFCTFLISIKYVHCLASYFLDNLSNFVFIIRTGTGSCETIMVRCHDINDYNI